MMQWWEKKYQVLLVWLCVDIHLVSFSISAGDSYRFIFAYIIISSILFLAYVLVPVCVYDNCWVRLHSDDNIVTL